MALAPWQPAEAESDTQPMDGMVRGGHGFVSFEEASALKPCWQCWDPCWKGSIWDRICPCARAGWTEKVWARDLQVLGR